MEQAKMRILIQKMIHYHKYLDPDEPPDLNKVEKFTMEYMKVLETACKENEYEPPSRYYRDCYNLYKRLYEFADNHLLFLHCIGVPSDNNLAERLLRIIKRKLKQVMSFRRFDSLRSLCCTMGLVASMRMNDKNLFCEATNIFDRVIPIDQ